MTFDPGNRLIVALDVADRYEADKLIERLRGTVQWFKVGLELFIAVGPDIVEDYAKSGLSIMLDLKLHDIPETVGRATARAAELGARLLTIHAEGGRPMMEAATKIARASGPDATRLRILAVTVLTSLDAFELSTLGITESPERAVLRRAQLAMEAGCDGVVASAQEAHALQKGAPEDFLVVTPGIRPEGAARGDQKRVETPRSARQAGADMIVVGRPIRDAADPVAAARAILAELG
jgi:orotidine-5'-phosphate decarboxylase